MDKTIPLEQQIVCLIMERDRALMAMTPEKWGKAERGMFDKIWDTAQPDAVSFREWREFWGFE